MERVKARSCRAPKASQASMDHLQKTVLGPSLCPDQADTETRGYAVTISSSNAQPGQPSGNHTLAHGHQAVTTTCISSEPGLCGTPELAFHFDFFPILPAQVLKSPPPCISLSSFVSFSPSRAMESCFFHRHRTPPCREKASLINSSFIAQ